MNTNETEMPDKQECDRERDRLGAIVREVWIAWAKEQPNPKVSWLVPYEQLSEPDQEVDRRIGERLYLEGRRLAHDKRSDGERSELIRWLQGKVSDAEKALKTREEEAAGWRIGTDKEWNAAANMHPSTAGNKTSKQERLKIADTHERIAVKLRHELAMYRAALAAQTEGKG